MIWIDFMNSEDRKRIKENLQYIAENPNGNFPPGWITEVIEEARKAGLLTRPSSIGCNCRPVIDAGISYGGDREEAF